MMNARLEELRSKFQENPRRYFAPFANELRKAGDPAQAISVCRAHLVGQPGHVSGHIVLGQALYEAGEANEARDIFTAALELDPENLIALRSLGEIAQVNGEFAMARQWYERLLDADPRNSEVAQLLKDIPDVPASEPVASSATASEVAESEPTPLTVRLEIEKEPEPTPVSKFHTTFSGSGPAYRSEAPDEEPAQQAQSAELPDEGQIERVAEAGTEPPMEPTVAAAPSEPIESPDMVDLAEFHSSLSTAASSEEFSLPDEEYAPPEDQALVGFYDMDFEPASSRHETPEAVEDVGEPAPVAEAEAEAPSEFAPPPPSDEPPRARFAENGFEGAADDHVDWMTTPSAAFSDLEAAPEDWLDESPAGAQEVTTESAEVSAESVSEESATAQTSASDHATDSWFENVEGASVIESTEVNSEEFWLPPELPQVFSREETSAPVDGLPETVPEAGAPVESPEEADSFAEASASQPMEHVEPENASLDAPDGAGEDAAVVESPAEVSMAAALPAPDDSEQMEEPRAIESADFVAYDADSAAVEATIVTPADTDALIGHTPSFDDAVVTPPPAPFVTETLAELYLQQGFRDEALAIYRQLAERDSSDQTLRRRIESIEQGDVPQAAPAADAAENRAASQSVRSFFSRLARRSAAPPGSLPHTTEPSQEVPFAAAASALANLFAAAKPPASDESAAATLAGAFTDPAGRPSRAADGELSLDHLFRDVPPGGSASGGVSLDEFYATPSAPPGSPTEPGEETDSAESGGTDIRQFTAWLEGLRKK
jgi:tetratricopeptide (TPR) repeat protein